MARAGALQSFFATSAVGFLMSLAPLSVYALGLLIFDVIGTPFSSNVLHATRSMSVAGMDASEAISDGHVWAATAHIYLTTTLFVLVLLIGWLRSRLRGFATFPYVSLAAFLSTLGVSYLLSANHNDRPIKTIFLFTYGSLVRAKFTGGSSYLLSIQRMRGCWAQAHLYSW